MADLPHIFAIFSSQISTVMEEAGRKLEAGNSQSAMRNLPT